MLHFQAKTYAPSDVKDIVSKDGNIYLDYYEGRMIKLTIHKLGDDTFSTNDGEANIEYQSWGAKYPTYEDLVSTEVVI